MKQILLTSLFLIIVGALFAQVAPPPGPLGGPGPAAGAPLDPLSWLLLGAGGTAAAGKYYKSKRNSK
jgi:hypothetical protein